MPVPNGCPTVLPAQKAMDMKNALPMDLLSEATRLTNLGQLTEATAALQQMLGRRLTTYRTNSQTQHDHVTIDGAAEKAGPTETRRTIQGVPLSGVGSRRPFFSSSQAPPHPTTPKGLRSLVRQANNGRFATLSGGLARPTLPPAPIAVPGGAQFLAATVSNQAGSRPYKLYVPNGCHPEQPVPLIIMLHGCTQSPDDFAAGTRMNEMAQDHCCFVAYPGQTTSANMQKCWNWFSECDQLRDGGEPSLIAGITREVMRNYAIDPRCVYIAGLSAGGAAAAIMGDTYPDLYAAIGVHSGLPCGAAHDIPSALTAMKHAGTGFTRRATRSSRSTTQRRIVPAIVFHGDRDTTVDLRNGDAVVTQSAGDAALEAYVEKGHVPGGHSYSRTRHVAPNGQTMIEQWLIHGAGHAWSGGSPMGSYTDPNGPDATKEFLRFFLEHPHPAAQEAA